MILVGLLVQTALMKSSGHVLASRKAKADIDHTPKKTGSPSFRNHKLPIAPQLTEGAHGHHPQFLCCNADLLDITQSTTDAEVVSTLVLSCSEDDSLPSSQPLALKSFGPTFEDHPEPRKKWS